VPSNHPNQFKSEPAKTTTETTAVRANSPAVTRCPVRSAPNASTRLTATANRASRTNPAAPRSLASTPSNAPVAKRIVMPPR